MQVQYSLYFSSVLVSTTSSGKDLSPPASCKLCLLFVAGRVQLLYLFFKQLTVVAGNSADQTAETGQKLQCCGLFKSKQGAKKVLKG